MGACAKKATPDRMMCDCLDKETADYITAHPNLTTDDLATAKEAIGTPCLAELQKEYPESEGKVFEKQHSKEEANTMMENIKRCGINLEITLQKVIDKSAVVASKTTNDPADEDSVGFIIDSEANDRTEHSADNCEDFLNKYEDYADSYATLAAKYARNPSDVSIVSEYTNMATKA